MRAGIIVVCQLVAMYVDISRPVQPAFIHRSATDSPKQFSKTV